MEERVQRIPPVKTWADEIDDLYHVATESGLRAILGTRARRVVLNPNGADDPLPGTESVQHGPAAGGTAR